jgi:hypothetical protein
MVLRSNLGGTPEILHGFPQSLQENSERVPRLGYDQFLPNPFQFVIHLSSDATQLDTESIGKETITSKRYLYFLQAFTVREKAV